MLDVPTDGNGTLAAVQDRANDRDHIRQHWECAHVMVTERLGYNKHGPAHVATVADNAITMLRLLDGVETPSIAADYPSMDADDAEVVVFLAAILHDVGQIVHRYKHSEYGLPIAADLMDELLEDLYDDREQVIMRSEVLHAIQSHHKKANPLTLEAGIIRVADALDIRAHRAGDEADRDANIHAISVRSVDSVDITAGEDVPIVIDVQLSNSSGIFQLDQLAKQKVEGSGLEEMVRIRADIAGQEKKLLEEYEL